MRLSSELKAELCRLPLGAREEILSELSGFAHAAGSITLHGGGALGLLLRADRACVARRAFLLLKEAGARPHLATTRGALGGRVYQLIVRPPLAEAVLSSCLLLDSKGRPLLRAGVPAPHVRRHPQRRAYVRGAFLGCGAATDPALDYHAEWTFAQAGFARDFAALLGRMGLEARRIERSEKFVVYLSGADRVAALLGEMGATAALFALENTRVLKTVRNETNRLVNAETANIRKTAVAAAAQIRQLEALRAGGRWAGIDEGLRALAEARLDNPDLSLAELGELLDPPLGKSGVSHRMRKLLEIAREADSP